MPTTRLNYSEEIITPDMARLYLQNNRANRKISEGRVRQYAEDMLCGDWRLNGECIIFYEDGSLANGQHRLNAVIKADKSVLFSVLRDIPLAAAVQDRGRTRSVSDAFVMLGMDAALANNRTVAAAKLHFVIQDHGNRNSSDGKIRRFIERNAEILTFIRSVTMRGGGERGRVNVDTALICLPCFYALNCGAASKEQVAAFLRVLRTGIPENMSQSAALVCRNDILSGSLPITGGASERIKSEYAIERALYDFCNAIERKRTYSTGQKPVYSILEINKNA